MRFACESCHAQYFIRDEKVGPNGIVATCKKCGHRIVVARPSSRDEDEEVGRAVDRALAAATAPERSATRVVDLAEMAGLLQGEQALEEKPAAQATDACGFGAAGAEWFVAIDEKQVGPLDVDAIRERFEKGELSPDSLCWKPGMQDWSRIWDVPRLAEDFGLRSLEKKEPAGATATGVQALVIASPPPIPLPTPAPRPAPLADLVRDELEALASRTTDPPAVAEEDEPSPPLPPPIIAFAEPPRAEPEPEIQAPVVAEKSQAGLYLAIGVPGTLLVLGSFVIALVFLTRPPPPLPQPQLPPPPPVVAALPPAPPPPVIVVEAPKPREEAPIAVVATAVKPPPPSPQRQRPPRPPVVEPTPPSKPDKADDPFTEIFEQEATPPPTPERKKTVLIPPAPGYGTGKPSLGNADVLEVLVANRARIKKCTDAAKGPDSSTIVMRWSIRPDGSVANVQTVSEDFRKTALSTCLTGVLTSLRFPVYSGPQMQPTEVPFRF